MASDPQSHEAGDDWDSHWQRYADVASLNPAQRFRHSTMIRLLAASRTMAHARLLDVGSGQGDFLVQAAARWPECRLCGFEMSATGVAITRRKLPSSEAYSVDLFHPGPEARPFLGWATHAVCSEVLEHVDEPAKFLAAAAQYMAPGGIMIVTVPGGPMSSFDRHIGHRQHFTPHLLKQVFSAAGFRSPQAWGAGFPFFNLYRMAVISRGDKLADEAVTMPWTGKLAMGLFDLLFRIPVPRTPWGWQIVGMASK